MASLVDVIQNNKWRSVSFEKSTSVNRLFTSGILTTANPESRSIIDALDESNVLDIVTLGLADIAWSEQNLGDTTDTEPNSIENTFETVQVKTFYGNQWWGVRGIQQDLLNASQPNRLVLERVGEYWATMWNRIITATVSGMADIAEITIGDGTRNLSRDMVLDARQKKGDMGYGRLATMYLNSKTMADILKKQEAGTINELITERYGQIELIKDGVRQIVQSRFPEYVYGGVTPVVVDDTMKDGIISLVDDASFVFYQKNLSTPMMYYKTPKSGNGVGKEEWGTKALYMLHPLGFSFKGVYGNANGYAKRSGLTIAELLGGGLYELKVDQKLSRIMNLRVKLGA